MIVIIKNEDKRNALNSHSIVADMDIVPRIGESIIIEDCGSFCEGLKEGESLLCVVTDVEHHIASGDRHYEDLGTTIYVKDKEQDHE